jgi:signal peptidase I
MIWRYIKGISLGLSLLLIIAAGAALVGVQARGGKLLSVQTGSMTPNIRKGDLVAVTRVPKSQLRVGNVVTYINPRNAKQTITHRIIALPSPANGQKFIVRGDANPAPDPPVNPASILGKVTFHAPYLGTAVDFVRTPIGLAILIYIPALLIVIDEVKRLSRHYRQQQPYSVLGRHTHEPGPRHTKRAAAGVSLLVFCFGLAIIVPQVQAALLSRATLSGNHITASSVAATNHILIRLVDFECSLDNTGQVNKLPSILFYNPTNKDISTGGWYLQSSNGKIVTFRPQTVFDAKSDYDIEPDLKAGVKYTGDFLALFDKSGNLVDAVSWGTDTSYLNPPLPGISDGTVFRRLNTVFDTNTTADWAVTVNPCTPGH